MDEQDEYDEIEKLRQTWEKEFRAAAAADGLAIFSDHLRRLALPDDDTDLMLEGTIKLVQLTSAYAGDEDELAMFLAMNTYDPAESVGARHAYTFDLNGRGVYARVLLQEKEAVLDLADLFEQYWADFHAEGFRCIWVSHPDSQKNNGKRSLSFKSPKNQFQFSSNVHRKHS